MPRFFDPDRCFRQICVGCKKMANNGRYVFLSMAFVLLLSFLSFFSFSEPTPEVVEERNTLGVSYGSESHQLVDLYFPAGKGPFPAVVYVTGVSGGSEQETVPQFVWEMKKLGWMVVVMAPTPERPEGYGVPIDRTVDDVRTVVLWLTRNASLYDVKKDSIVVTGVGVGGTAAALGTYGETSANYEIAGVIMMGASLETPSLKTEAERRAFGCQALCTTEELVNVTPATKLNIFSPDTYLIEEMTAEQKKVTMKLFTDRTNGSKSQLWIDDGKKINGALLRMFLEDAKIR
jgi:hypothetical protein